MDGENENGGYTSFKIIGDFEPDEITRRLGLTPDRQNRVGDKISNGEATYREASWAYGYCKANGMFVEDQMMAALRNLFPKIKELNQIRRDFDVAFYLITLVQLAMGNNTLSLMPYSEAVRFLYETDTQMSVDIWLDEREEDAAPRQNTDKL